VGDIVIFFFIQNIIIFCLIFWFLTWGGEYFFKKKNHFNKKKFYECGFNSLSDINIQININFTMLCIFLILYDIELTFLFPILFNLFYINIFEFFIFIIFLLLIIFSLIYDWQMNSMNWQY